MTTRADLIETATKAAVHLVMGNLPVDLMDDKRMKDWARLLASISVRAALDAVLPQIITAEQLEALPEGAAVSFGGFGFPMLLRVSPGTLRNDTWTGTFEQAVAELGPLTVVWQPQPEQP